MKINRRDFSKGLIALSTALVIMPFGALYKYLSVPLPVIKLTKIKIANKKDVELKGKLIFAYPIQTRPAILLHIGPATYEVGNYWEEDKTTVLNEDRFVAYDGVCTHLGCPVGWIEGEVRMGPSCHGARFSPVDGTVRAGPPRRRIPKIKLEIDENGDIYANGYESGLPLYGLENVIFEKSE